MREGKDTTRKKRGAEGLKMRNLMVTSCAAITISIMRNVRFTQESAKNIVQYANIHILRNMLEYECGEEVSPGGRALDPGSCEEDLT